MGMNRGDPLEIGSLHQQLSAVQQVNDALHKEKLELQERLQASRSQAEGARETCQAACCVICMDNLVNTVCLPCRHLALCSECGMSGNVSSCPICRCPVEDKMVVFMS